jgi:LytS/YehU family sensor histidine kinase
LVPALLLQPLVENAVKHGIGKRTGKGTVSMRGRMDGPDLLIEIEDRSEGPLRSLRPLMGASASSKIYDDDERPGTGIALKTLRQRLSHVYGRQAKLTLDPTEHGMIVSVRLPEKPASAAEAAQ